MPAGGPVLQPLRQYNVRAPRMFAPSYDQWCAQLRQIGVVGQISPKDLGDFVPDVPNDFIIQLLCLIFGFPNGVHNHRLDVRISFDKVSKSLGHCLTCVDMSWNSFDAQTWVAHSPYRLAVLPLPLILL